MYSAGDYRCRIAFSTGANHHESAADINLVRWIEWPGLDRAGVLRPGFIGYPGIRRLNRAQINLSRHILLIPLPGAGRDCLGVLVADASGHGIGAALLAVETCAYLRGVALTVSDVGSLLGLANLCFSNDPTSCHFVTAFLMRLDPGTRSLDYTSAGHLPGYVLDQRGQTRLILNSTGLPLGIMPMETYSSSTIHLEPGDLVLLITDGITEAASPGGQLFGMERTLQLVRQHQQQTPDEILTALFAAVRDYSNDNCVDDMTAVIIKVNGSA